MTITITPFTFHVPPSGTSFIGEHIVRVNSLDIFKNNRYMAFSDIKNNAYNHFEAVYIVGCQVQTSLTTFVTSSLIVRMLRPVHSKWELRNIRYEFAQYMHGVYNSNMHIKIFRP